MDNLQYTEQWISKEWALEQYESYKTMLYRIAFAYMGNKFDCEDILHDAFIKLCYHAPNFSSKDDEKRWIIRVTINLCKDRLRSFWHRNKVDLEELKEYASEPKDLEIMQDILRLPAKYKTVIHLHYFEGYKIKEISQILRISESAVKMRLKRGRELLKIELEGSYEN